MKQILGGHSGSGKHMDEGKPLTWDLSSVLGVLCKFRRVRAMLPCAGAASDSERLKAAADVREFRNRQYGHAPLLVTDVEVVAGMRSCESFLSMLVSKVSSSVPIIVAPYSRLS